MQRSDHHDWTSDTYVEEWVRRQKSEDATRAERFQLLCDLFPFFSDATVTILDVGAGYGPVSKFILDRYPHATCKPMLKRAETIMADYGTRFITHQSDLFDPHWLPERFGPFDAAVSSSCLHNLRDFKRITEIYGEIYRHLKPAGVFLNLDLINAPTSALRERYDAVAVARRQRQGTASDDIAAMVRHREASPVPNAAGPFPANLDQHLAALKSAGFHEVDCFWKDLRRTLIGGYV
jgi:SAM-dependent methyltransferase